MLDMGAIGIWADLYTFFGNTLKKTECPPEAGNPRAIARETSSRFRVSEFRHYPLEEGYLSETV